MSDIDRKLWRRALPVLLFVVIAGVYLLWSGGSEPLQQTPAIAVDTFQVPEHHIPPEYFRDAKPATPLSESKMLTIVISQQTYEWFSPADKPGIVVIPVAYLDFANNFTNTTSLPTWHEEKSLRPDEGVAMIRMPVTMYDRFLEDATGPTLELPESSFVRRYDNLTELYARVRPDGTFTGGTGMSPGVPAVIETVPPTPPTLIITTPRVY